MGSTVRPGHPPGTPPLVCSARATTDLQMQVNTRCDRQTPDGHLTRSEPDAARESNAAHFCSPKAQFSFTAPSHCSWCGVHL
ncbi:unnamed protein product [Lota lota]